MKPSTQVAADKLDAILAAGKVSLFTTARAAELIGCSDVDAKYAISSLRARGLVRRADPPRMGRRAAAIWANSNHFGEFCRRVEDD